MPGVDKNCTTHHFSACDCMTQKILGICECAIKVHEDWVDNIVRKNIAEDAKDIIKTINILKG